MHFCTAMIAIGEDKQQVLFAGMHSPISWPEIQVIQMLHGQESVDEVRPFVWVQQSPREERQRLVDKYGEDKVMEVFPRQGPSEMDAPAATIAHGEQWLDPRTLTLTMIEEDPHANTAFTHDPLAGENPPPPLPKRVAGRFVSQQGG